MKCKDCKFSLDLRVLENGVFAPDGIGGYKYECRRFPPTGRKIKFYHPNYVFPTVPFDLWCHEFKEEEETNILNDAELL